MARTQWDIVNETISFFDFEVAKEVITATSSFKGTEWNLDNNSVSIEDLKETARDLLNYCLELDYPESDCLSGYWSSTKDGFRVIVTFNPKKKIKFEDIQDVELLLQVTSTTAMNDDSINY